MRELTGQDVLVRAVDQLAGSGPRGPRYADAARIMHIRNLRPDIDSIGEQIGRWYRGEVKTPADIALRALDAIGGINWAALEEPGSQAAMEAELEATKRRTAELEHLLDVPSAPPSADPGKP